MRQKLRPYQERAIEEVRAAIRAGRKRVLIVSPTGSGKTTVAAEIIHGAVEKGSRVLFLAHRKELIDQCSRRLDEWSVDHGVIQANHPRTNVSKPVQVASIATLIRRLESGRADANAELIIIDEAHRSMADTYKHVVASHPEAIVLGLTATPVRNDGRGLADLYEKLILVAQPPELIAAGFLMEPIIFVGSTGDLSQVHKRKGDFIESQLAAAVDRPKLIGDIVQNWLLHVGRNKRTVVFAVNVAHSKNIVDEFAAAGVRAAHLDGKTPRAEREATLSKLLGGELEVISNCMILTEGWDLPTLDAVVLARPTASIGLALQMVGRVLRPAKGKERALILDHAGNTERHRWPTVAVDWPLQEAADTGDGDGHEGGRDPDPTKNCPQCGCTVPSTRRKCDNCGFEFPVETKDPDVVPQILRPVTKEEFYGKPNNALAVWVAIAKRKGMKTGRNGFPGWAGYRFKEVFGRWPSLTEILDSMKRTSTVEPAERPRSHTKGIRMPGHAQMRLAAIGETED